MTQKHKSGFALFQMMIVLVIIGLITGSIVIAKDLIHAGELRSVINESEKYKSAVFTFREKYLGWPGDLSNAYDFFGSDCGTDSTTSDTGCNGDGDGYIMWDDGLTGEGPKAWEHLSLAELIEVRLDGSLTGSQCVSGVNVPKSKLNNANWFILSSNDTNIAGVIGKKNILGVGGCEAGTAVLAPYILTTQEAYDIDKKLDDGGPDTGEIRGDNATDCYGTTYDLTLEGQICNLYFVLQQ